MKSFWYKFLVSVLSLGMLYPTWLATGAQKAKAGIDTEPPYLANIGFDVDGANMQYGPGNYYYLAADGNSTTDHLLNFDDLTAGNEPLAADYYGLYLIGSQVSSVNLKQYYEDRGVPEPYLSYLKQAVDGERPFAYIKCDGSADVDLVDAAKHDLASIDTDMVIPGNYPSGWYSVSTKAGEGFKDLAGNEGSISFNLIIDSTKPDVTVLTPTDAEEIAGASGVDYKITWIARDDESGIKANSVEIKYYNGVSWATLVSGLANVGTYDWAVPADHTNAGKIRVIAYNNVDLKGKDTAKDLDIDDRTAPVITLNGDQEISVLKGSTYNDLGATAIDNYDGDVTANIVTTSTVDTNVVGEYKVTYNVTDIAGNDAVEVERIVKVVNLPFVGNLSAVPDVGEVSLSWDAVAGAVSYNVYYKKTSEADYVGPINVATNATKITGLTNGVSYDFRVVAVNENGVEGEAAVVTATPKSSMAILATTSIVQEEVTQPETPVAPESTITTPTEEEEQPEVGQIKGEETSTAEEESINWTPWIILFVLIILAGAATGGYFYWFGSEEEEIVSEQVIEKSRKSNDKKSTAKKSSSKKSKRW